jgi:Zn-dependent protease
MEYSLIAELVNIAITAIAVSYIFTAFVPKKTTDALMQYTRGFFSSFDKEQFKTAALISIPAIILHEMFHKFASIIFGIPATYQVSYIGLGIGVFLRAISSGIIFFIPGYVQILGTTTYAEMAIIAFAGPFANLLLFLGAFIALKYFEIPKKYLLAVHLTKKINLWLLILNLLPIPPLDGSKVILGLYHVIGGLL